MSKGKPIGILIINDDQFLFPHVKRELGSDQNYHWKCVCVGTQDDLDVVWEELERFKVALVDIRLRGFTYDGLILAEMLQKRGIKVGIASV